MNLYVDDELIELAKSKRINMSQMVRNMLSIENELIKGQELDILKIANLRIIEENQRLRLEIETLKKEV